MLQTPNAEPNIENFESYLDISIDETLIDGMADWYALAKLSSPKQLNLLKGTFLKAKQYDEDLQKRKSALDPRNPNIQSYMCAEKIDKIIKILDLAQLFAGRIANNWQDYYDTKDNFALEMSKFTDFGCRNFEEFKNFDSSNVYSDEENPILHATVEQAKMYGSLSFLEKICQDDKISKGEYEHYRKMKKSANYEECNKMLKANLNNDKVAEWFVRNKEAILHMENRIKLHDVSKVNSLLMDLYGQLISWEYKWERDRIYFLMGSAYFARRKDLPNIEKITIFGENLDGNYGKTGGTMGKKFDAFVAKSKIGNLYKSVFETNNLVGVFRKTRNGLDHFDLFTQDKESNSILEYYNIMLSLFEYDRKQKNVVMARFKKILESYFLKANLKFGRFEKTETGILTQVSLETYRDKWDNEHPAIENQVQKEVFKNIKIRNKTCEVKHCLNNKNFENLCVICLNLSK